jgi:gluconolactonase
VRTTISTPISPAANGEHVTYISARPPATAAQPESISVSNVTAAPAPSGCLLSFELSGSTIFPGTIRTIKVYVPDQYRADAPACAYFGLDGLTQDLPEVFARLIGADQIPVVIAIGVEPGHVPSTAAPANPRYNRSFEFDSLNADLARFLMDEVTPAVEQLRTPDGRPVLLSRNPQDRAIGGVSTGGIGAFTAAWERPDAFSRVFTGIGTFVCMRGGDRYPGLVRKTEPKPLRIFMQDGCNDQWQGGPEFGDWWLGNQTMQRALEFAGYDVRHVWTDGAHDTEHATQLFPDALRWLWSDWPQPIRAGGSRNTFLQQILLAGESWSCLPGHYRSPSALASDCEGKVTFRDASPAGTWRISLDGECSQQLDELLYHAMAHDASGRCFVIGPERSEVLAYDHCRRLLWSVGGFHGALSLAPNHQGAVYVTESREDGKGRLWIIRPSGERSLLDTDLDSPAAIALSPDGLWLAVAEHDTHWGISYRVEPGGSLLHKQKFYWFHIPDTADDSGVRAWVPDIDGRLYAATRMGVQVFDRNGRVRAILPLPGGAATGLAFGGADFKTLYVACADGRLYRRRVAVAGFPSGAAPIELPEWHFG